MIKLPFIDYSKEKFLILEIYPSSTKGVLISIDPDKKITLEKIWENFSWSNLSRHFRQKVTNWNVVVAASPLLAATTILPVRLDRDRGSHSAPISAPELENLLAQATTKIFNQCRSFASRVLATDELDTILVDNRVINFRVDGHQVINPIDFKAKRIDAILELTLTTRAVFESWKNFFNIGQARDFFFTEISRSELSVLSKFKTAPQSLVVVETGGTTAFHLDPSSKNMFVKRATLDWDMNEILGAIRNNWGVEEPIAREIYSNYLKKEASPAVMRHLSRLLEPILTKFSQALQKTGFTGLVYLDSELPLPFVFPKKLSRMTLNDMPISSILEKFGFKADLKNWPIPDYIAARRLAPLLEFYYNNDKETDINHWLRRRLHWLGSGSWF